MVTRCRAVVVGLLGVLFVVGGCGGGPGNSNGVGRPCDLLADAGQTQAVYNNQAAECPSGLCLKPANQLAAMVTTGATCSAECTRDSDCNGEMRDMSDPMDKRCTNGFACAVPFVVGPLCCKKLCTCKDFLGPGSLATPVTCDPAQNQGLGCQDVSGAAGTGAPTPNPLQETDFTILVSPQREVDILFMVDNSPSMDPKQAALAANFPKMIQSLQALPGGLPDVHIGVSQQRHGGWLGKYRRQLLTGSGRPGPFVGQRSQQSDCLGRARWHIVRVSCNNNQRVRPQLGRPLDRGCREYQRRRDGHRTTPEISRTSSLASPRPWESTAAVTSTNCNRFEWRSTPSR